MDYRICCYYCTSTLFINATHEDYPDGCKQCSNCGAKFKLILREPPPRPRGQGDWRDKKYRLWKRAAEKLGLDVAEEKEVAVAKTENEWTKAAAYCNIVGKLKDTLYDEKFCALISDEDVTGKAIADFAKVSSATGSKWKKKINELRRVIK